MSESQKLADWLTPERRDKHDRIREEIKAELPEIREHARERHERHEDKMRGGSPPHLVLNVLRFERNRQGLSDDEMMARSGLDAEALASMAERDAHPAIETMDAYARALGKRLLIVLADEESSEGS
jgi:hypothetical protein